MNRSRPIQSILLSIVLGVTAALAMAAPALAQGNPRTSPHVPASPVAANPHLLAPAAPTDYTLNEYSFAGYSGGTYGMTTGPDGNVWFGGEVTATTYGLFRADGANPPNLLSFGFTDPAGTPIVAPLLGKLVFASDGSLWSVLSGSVYQMSITSTSPPLVKLLNTYPAAGSGRGIAAAPNGTVWVNNTGGTPSTRSIWRFTRDPNNPGNPWTQLSIHTGSLTYDVVYGSDGNVWYSSNTANQIGRLSLDGATDTEFATSVTHLDGGGSSASYPRGIGQGADGNIWFVDNNNQYVGRVIPATGAITYFGSPDYDSYGDFMIPSPDGSLWMAGSDVERVNPNGVFQEIGLQGNLTGVAVTADGRVWITLETNKLAVVAPSRPRSGVWTATHYPVLPNTCCNLAVGEALDANGNLWFVTRANSIGETTNAGVIRQWALPAGSAPGGIALGADGMLWVTEIGNTHVARVDPAQTLANLTATAVVTEFLARPGLTKPIISGPGGDLWFVECTGANHFISHLATSATAGTLPTDYPTPACAVDLTFTGGKVWFTESGVAGLFSINPDGTLNAPIALSGGGGAVTSGPDGTIWVGDTTNQRIDRVTSAGTVTEWIADGQCCVGPSKSAGGMVIGPDFAIWTLDQYNCNVDRFSPLTGSVEVYGPEAIYWDCLSGASLIVGSDNRLWLGSEAGQGLLAIGPLLVAPTLTALSPTSTPVNTSPTVTITGTDFTMGSTVTFGGVAATNVVVTGPTSMTVTAPASAIGQVVDVRVTTLGGITPVTAADRFTYVPPPPVITGETPVAGPITGGTTVIVSGSNLAGPLTVTVNGIAAASFIYNADGTITLVTPNMTAGNGVVLGVDANGRTIVQFRLVITTLGGTANFSPPAGAGLPLTGVGPTAAVKATGGGGVNPWALLLVPVLLAGLAIAVRRRRRPVE